MPLSHSSEFTFRLYRRPWDPTRLKSFWGPGVPAMGFRVYLCCELCS